jgi:hypothetical protein
MVWGDCPARGVFLNLSALAILMATFLLRSAPATAQEFGTADDARAMLARAVAALKSNETAALNEFNDPNDIQFHDRDLYVFCYRMSDGKITSFSGPMLIGVDVRTLMLNLEPIGQQAYDTVKHSPEGNVTTLDYEFPKPGTLYPVPKRSLGTRIGDQGCGVAYYK